MESFSAKGLADDGNSSFRSLAILLKNISYYFLLLFISNTETVLCCAE
jgi:hypothetical protein